MPFFYLLRLRRPDNREISGAHSGQSRYNIYHGEIGSAFCTPQVEDVGLYCIF